MRVSSGPSSTPPGGSSRVERPDGSRWSTAARMALGAADPGLAGGLATYRDLVGTFAGRRPAGLLTAAVIGPTPGTGRSTVAATLALALSAHTPVAVTVVDAAGPSRNRPVGTLLAGTPQSGRLDVLIGVPPGEPVARSVVRAAADADTAVPVLEPPPGAGFPPQLLEQITRRLQHRTDLVLFDTPGSPTAPVQHAVLDSVGHLFLVLPADESAQVRAQQLVAWVAGAPGRRPAHTLSLVLVGGSRRFARGDFPVPAVWLRPSRALAAGRLAAIGRRETVDGLRIAASVPGLVAGS
jgi:hypothetical protein